MALTGNGELGFDSGEGWGFDTNSEFSLSSGTWCINVLHICIYRGNVGITARLKNSYGVSISPSREFALIAETSAQVSSGSEGYLPYS
jgi:hypothetical protein